MKCAVVLADGVSQVMLWPENDVDKQALRLMTPDMELSTEYRRGTFYGDNIPASAGYAVHKCQGDYMRAFRETDALMIVVRPKQKESGT